MVRAVKVLFQMYFIQFSSSFAPKTGPLVQFIVQFFTIKIQEKEELSSVQVPKNQVNFIKARTNRDTGSVEPGSRPIFGSVSGSESQF